MYRVLVVDDDPASRAVVTAQLRHEGFEVATAADGYLAIAAMQRRSVDLIVSDVMMPNLGGVRLVELLRNQGVRVPVILLTGLSEPPRHQADALIRKPYAIDELIGCVDDLLRTRHAGTAGLLREPWIDAHLMADVGA
jgi:two-component system response regulator MprA